MALVRVYCGISSAVEEHVGAMARLTVAVVDDSGRLLEYCEINDDPAGYAAVTSLLAERFGGSTTITVAVDSDDHLVVSLLAASGRAIAYTDDETADVFAERFADDDSMEEVQAGAAERRAVGLARALQAGEVSATVVPVPRELVALKPVLAAHSALAVGRHATAVALREVLRELYPAALRAYPDPAAPVALAMLDALPEPGLLTAAAGRGRDAAVTVAARLVADGVCDNDTALEAVTALRVAINESPKRNGAAKQMTAAVADAVRASVAAVRSTDTAVLILIQTMSERIAPSTAGPATAVTQRRRVTPTPISAPAAAPRPTTSAPIAPAPIAAPPLAPMPMPVPVAAGSSRPAWASSTPPPTPPGFEPTPVSGTPIIPRPAAIPAQRTPPPPTGPLASDPSLAPFVPTLSNAAISSQKAAFSLNGVPAQEQDPIAAPGSRANWPLVPDFEDEARPVSPAPKSNRVTPPWQADDLVLPASLRLVESNPDAPLRLVDDTALTSRIPKPRRTERAGGGDMSDDMDLLIFASVSSAWFNGDGDGENTWNSSMDLGWQAAEAASLRPSIGEDTRAGLPRRVPQANLVPGSSTTTLDRPLRIVRDAGEIAAHTSNYFRGSRRGNQEAGSFAVGGRPGRESASGWEFSREHEIRDERERGEYGQRAVNYR